MGFWKSLGLFQAATAKTPGEAIVGMGLASSEEENNNEKVVEKELTEDALDRSVKRVMDDLNLESMSDLKKQAIEYINNFVNENRSNLNLNQIDHLYKYIDDISKANDLTLSIMNEKVMKYIQTLAPFIYIHIAMKEMKDQIMSFSDDKLPRTAKLKIFKLIAIVNDSIDIDILKYNLNELETYLTKELKVKVNFDYVYFELEKCIEKYKD